MPVKGDRMSMKVITMKIEPDKIEDAIDLGVKFAKFNALFVQSLKGAYKAPTREIFVKFLSNAEKTRREFVDAWTRLTGEQTNPPCTWGLIFMEDQEMTERVLTLRDKISVWNVTREEIEG
jgi:hypothetical protein